jgi:hypothetical protein
VPTGSNTITDLYETAASPLAENAQYVVLALIMLGQALGAVSVFWGQTAYLLGNAIGIWRCFRLSRPMADKVKDIGCLGLTITILIMEYL